MTRLPNMWAVALVCLILAALHVFALTILVPTLSKELAQFYNLNKSPDGYDVLAVSLIAGNGFRFQPDTAPTLLREPGYPVFLAGVFLIFGQGITTVKIANVCLALASALLLPLIARRIVSRRAVLLWSPILFLCHPGTLAAESRGGVEILTGLLIIIFVLALDKAIQRNRLQDFVVSGVALGVLALVRSTFIMLPVLVAVYVLCRRNDSYLKIGRNIASLALAMGAVLSPWMIRNYLRTGLIIPTASTMGISAHSGQYICTHLTTTSRWVDLDRDAAEERRKLALEQGYLFKDIRDSYYQLFYRTEDEVKFSAYLKKMVIDKYRSNPSLIVECGSRNLFNFWFAGKSWTSTGVNFAIQLPYLVLAVVGAAWSAKRRQFRRVAPVVLVIIYTVGVSVPILAQARYSVPLIPLLSVLASTALMATGEKLSELIARWRGRSGPWRRSGDDTVERSPLSPSGAKDPFLCD